MILHGNNIELLKTLPANSVDSIVTDPPYGLSFMNKHWDYDVPSIELWKECLRVLKPGGHLLSFAGTRTYHRMTVRIEDAGFEIRDMISWIYGSGFPKSLDIGKAIDKSKGAEREVIETIKKTPISVEGSNDGWKRPSHYNPDGTSKNTMNITAPATPEAIKYNGWGTALKPASEIICVAQKPYMYQEKFVYLVHKLITKICEGLCQSKSFVKIAKKNLALSPNELKEGVNIVQWIADENTNIQDVLSVVMVTLQSCIKENTNLSTVLLWLNILKEIYSQENTYTTETKTNLITDLKILNSLPLMNIVNCITGEKIKQDGQELSAEIAVNIFNAVKVKLSVIQMLFAQESATGKPLEFSPNCNPIVLARKPVEGTIANNVLRYGTGGINIDGCRIGVETIKHSHDNTSHQKWKELDGRTPKEIEKGTPTFHTGRFPANIIFDEISSVLLDEQSGELSGAGNKIGSKKKAGSHFGSGQTQVNFKYDNGGGASRFFYCAKASKSERNGGLEGFEEKETFQKNTSEFKYDNRHPDGGYEHKPQKQNNHHPTVKPLKLMQYLVRLVTPPNGVCLDPFAGSGTTGMACEEEGLDYILMEREAEYIPIIKARIEWIKKRKKDTPEQTNLFKSV